MPRRAPHDRADTWGKLRSLVLDRNERRARVTAELGMSFVRVKALRIVAAGPVTMRALAERQASDPPNVTVIVDDLQSRASLRRPHPTDRRSKVISVTAAGATAAAAAERILGEPPAALRALAQADLAELDRIVTTLLE